MPHRNALSGFLITSPLLILWLRKNLGLPNNLQPHHLAIFMYKEKKINLHKAVVENSGWGNSALINQFVCRTRKKRQNRTWLQSQESSWIINPLCSGCGWPVGSDLQWQPWPYLFALVLQWAHFIVSSTLNKSQQRPHPTTLVPRPTHHYPCASPQRHTEPWWSCHEAGTGTKATATC